MIDALADPSRIDRRRFVASLLAAPIAARLALRHAIIAHSAERVVVIGAGAFGGWSALALLRSGAHVTLVDAWGAGNSRASSGGETRVIRAVYNGEPVYTRMAARALELWQAAEKSWGRQVFFPVGSLWMCAGDDAFVRRSVAPIRAAGLEIHELTMQDAERRFPQMSFAGVKSAFFEPHSGYLLARPACEL